MISWFDNRFDVKPKVEALDWDTFVARLAWESVQARAVADKERAPAWTPALYSPGKTRALENATTATVLALDSDDGWEACDAMSAMVELGFAFIIHSTTRSLETNNRFRLILPLDRPVDQQEYKRLWQRMQACFDGVFDTNASDITRLNTVPALWSGADNQFDFAPGTTMPVDHILSYVPPEPIIPVPVEPPRPKLFDYRAKAREAAKRARAASVDRMTLIDLDTSPIVPADALSNAMTGAKGARTYRFLCSVALSAVRNYYDITEWELERIAEAYSHRVGRKPDPKENARDAKRALEFASTHAEDG